MNFSWIDRMFNKRRRVTSKRVVAKATPLDKDLKRLQFYVDVFLSLDDTFTVATVDSLKVFLKELTVRHSAIATDINDVRAPLNDFRDGMQEKPFSHEKEWHARKRMAHKLSLLKSIIISYYKV